MDTFRVLQTILYKLCSVPTAAGGMLPQLSLYVTTAIASLGAVLGLGKHSRK